MADVVVNVDAANALLMLRNGEKRIRYAIVNATNRTAKGVQIKQRENAARTFTIRKTEFIRREVAKIDFASVSKGIYEARVYVGQKRRLLLSEFEKGGTRRGFVGKNVAVPVLGGARPTKQSEIPAQFRFSQMRLKAYRGNRKLTRKARGRHVRDYGVFGEYGRLALPERGNRVQWKGKNRTYLVPGVGVFQRTGPGQSRLLWHFQPSVRLLPQLRFIVTGTDVARSLFDRYLAQEVRNAFARAALRPFGGLTPFLVR